MEHFIVVLESYPTFYYSFILVIGLCIGSFLNVVIYRYPLMMISDWRDECIEFFKLPENTIEKKEKLNLAFPASHCPKCKKRIAIWQNIPLISFILLKGKCHNCQEHISLRYPGVELFTGLLSLYVAIYFGVDWKAFYALIFTWTLIVISGIDLDYQLIPDIFSLTLMWVGLLININGLFVPLSSAVIGAAAGYMSLWIFMNLFKLVTGKVGMGHGDFKLVACLGAWMGWQTLAFIIILASLLGTIVGILMILFKRLHRDNPIPFGPYIAVAGWVTLFFGQDIINSYLFAIGVQ